MKIKKLSINGLILAELDKFEDARGNFFEIFNSAKAPFPDFEGIKQINYSYSVKNTLRGLHYQIEPHGQSKLIHVVEGKIFDVAVDIRMKSPTFKNWISAVLDSSNPEIFYIPKGFAHGFCVLSETAKVVYCVSGNYDVSCERGISFDDPELDIPWPNGPHVMSEKDKTLPLLSNIIDFF